MLIVYRDEGTGWSPVAHMARLAAQCFDAELVSPEPRQPTPWEKLRALGARRTGSETCLVIAPYPWDVTSFLQVEGWWRRFGRTAVWIIDSFWVNMIPRLARSVRLFDHLFVTTEEDVIGWSRASRSPTTHLPWGTDALRLGSRNPLRRLDLLRVGRQPPEWEDDRATAEACQRHGLRFEGRPPVPASVDEAQGSLMARYAESRFVLAFSNRVNPTRYTHPTREYVTGRWVDALACGAVVAGVAPGSPDARRLLWPGATLELGGVRREEGLRILADAARRWSPAQARLNHRNALERLDWRWRFEEIATVLGESPPRLCAELDELRAAIGAPDTAGGEHAGTGSGG
jgi:hypothetical protein